MPDGIQRYNIFHASEDRYRSPEGEWVRFSDVQARLEAADRLAERMTSLSGGLREAGHPAADAIDRALVAYRSTGESTPAPDETGGK